MESAFRVIDFDELETGLDDIRDLFGEYNTLLVRGNV
jgi:hypothetical protein